MTRVKISSGEGVAEGGLRPVPSARKQTLGKYKRILLNSLFAALTVVGQVGQNVSLPLLLDSSSQIKPYFVLLFASLAFCVLFGIGILAEALFFKTPSLGGKPLRSVVFIGIFSALNGILVVYSAPGTRTPPFLQSVLMNFQIPITILARWVLLKRTSSKLQIFCAGGVMFGLMLCLVPSIFNLDKAENAPPVAPGPWKVIWPIVFMVGFAPGAVQNVLEERVLETKEVKSLKAVTGDRQGELEQKLLPDTPERAEDETSIMLFLFWMFVGQGITMVAFFWVDLLPTWGFSSSASQTWDSVRIGMECFCGGAGCSGASGARGTAFIVFYAIAYLGSALLLKYADGATWVALVNAFVTPLGAFFWTVFREDPFGWDPEWAQTTSWTVVGVFVMIPFIVYFNVDSYQVHDKTDAPTSYKSSFDPDQLQIESGGQQITIDRL